MQSSDGRSPVRSVLSDSQKHFRRRIYYILEQPGGSRTGILVHAAILLLIVANVIAVIFESVEEIGAAYAIFFHDFELISILAFSVEYIVRAWVAVENGRYRKPVAGRFRYLLTPMAIIDLIAVLPFFLGMFFYLDTRMLRVVRLFRVFKLTRHFGALEILLKVIRAEARSLGAALFVLMVLVVLASAGMYAAERDVQPSAFGNIPQAMWWATVTLTTVGYGDVVPITAAGRFFSGVIVILGIGIAALPAGIIAAGFTQELQRRREAFRLVAHEALADGVIDEDERHLLEATRKDLDMDREEANMVLHEELAGKKVEHNSAHCPHCGKPLLQEQEEGGSGV